MIFNLLELNVLSILIFFKERDQSPVHLQPNQKITLPKPDPIIVVTEDAENRKVASNRYTNSPDVESMFSNQHSNLSK